MWDRSGNHHSSSPVVMGMEHWKKIPSKGVTLVTSKRGSLEKNKTGTAEPTVRQKKEAEKEARSSWALVSIWWGPQ